MKIVVIGRTGLVRSKIVERLQRLGHDAAAAGPRRCDRFGTEAPRDPGCSGRYLRDFLEGVALILRDLWHRRYVRTGQLRRLLFDHSASDRHTAELDSRRPPPGER